MFSETSESLIALTLLGQFIFQWLAGVSLNMNLNFFKSAFFGSRDLQNFSFSLMGPEEFFWCRDLNQELQDADSEENHWATPSCKLHLTLVTITDNH